MYFITLIIKLQPMSSYMITESNLKGLLLVWCMYHNEHFEFLQIFQMNPKHFYHPPFLSGVGGGVRITSHTSVRWRVRGKDNSIIMCRFFHNAFHYFRWISTGPPSCHQNTRNSSVLATTTRTAISLPLKTQTVVHYYSTGESDFMICWWVLKARLIEGQRERELCVLLVYKIPNAMNWIKKKQQSSSRINFDTVAQCHSCVNCF